MHTAPSETPDFTSVTEVTGTPVTQEQIYRVCNRYYWAADYVRDKEVVEVACGSGQGLGLLASKARNIVAGDVCPELVDVARTTYGDRIQIDRLDASSLPFPSASKDVIIIFEALYYLPSAEDFVKECQRVLRPGGHLLISTANCDLFDFNPSPYSIQYFGVPELSQLLQHHQFEVECFGSTPVQSISIRQKVLRPIKKVAVNWNLIPKTMAGKRLLKRIVFGKMVQMPAELSWEMADREPIKRLSNSKADNRHKVIYCAARKPYSQ